MESARVYFGAHVSHDVSEKMRADLSAVGVATDEVRSLGDEGGPAEYAILVLAALMPVFNAFLGKAGEDAWSVFRRVFYLDLRNKNGSLVDRGVCIQDDDRSLSVVISSETPDQAIRRLMELSAQGLLESAPGSGKQVYWSESLQTWLTVVGAVQPWHLGWRPDSAYSRRLPPRPSRATVPAATATPAPHAADDVELARLDKGRRSSAWIRRQRAGIVWRWLRGTPPERIAQSMVVSTELVRATILDYRQVGAEALDPGFAAGVDARVDSDIAEQIVTRVRSVPERWRRKRTISYQANELVLDGVIEDIGYRTLDEILVVSDIHIPL